MRHNGSTKRWAHRCRSSASPRSSVRDLSGVRARESARSEVLRGVRHGGARGSRLEALCRSLRPGVPALRSHPDGAARFRSRAVAHLVSSDRRDEVVATANAGTRHAGRSAAACPHALAGRRGRHRSWTPRGPHELHGLRSRQPTLIVLRRRTGRGRQSRSLVRRLQRALTSHAGSTIALRSSDRRRRLSR